MILSVKISSKKSVARAVGKSSTVGPVGWSKTISWATEALFAETVLAEAVPWAVSTGSSSSSLSLIATWKSAKKSCYHVTRM